MDLRPLPMQAYAAMFKNLVKIVKTIDIGNTGEYRAEANSATGVIVLFKRGQETHTLCPIQGKYVGI